AVPLYERLKFLAIYSSNLDEFFMVRVAGLQAQVLSQIHEVTPDGPTVEQQLDAISERAHELTALQYRIWAEQIRPALRAAGVALAAPGAPHEAVLVTPDQHFERDLSPVLTPIAIDPAHPFPPLRIKAINVAFMFHLENPSEP